MDGIQAATTQSLLAIRENLLQGIDKVGEHMDNGTENDAKDSKSVPPIVAGQTTLILLGRVNEELFTRGFQVQW